MHDEQHDHQNRFGAPVTELSGASPWRVPELDPAAALLFVINSACARHDASATRVLIEAALRQAGRTGELCFAKPGELSAVAERAAAAAAARHSAVIAVGGDGTLSAVAQAAHAQVCAMGVLPQGTFNYFARTHGIATDAAAAMQTVLHATPVPVQVGLINERVFLVNASLGLYPDMLEDREAYAARFGRSRWVAGLATLATLLGRHRRLRLRIEVGATVREVITPTLFVGNNRLQLEQVGVLQAPGLDRGCMAAVMLRPIGAWALLGLLWRGSIGTLGEAATVESFQFHRMLVQTRRAWGRSRVKVACDGEVSWLRSPLTFGVSPRPLYLLRPGAAGEATGLAQEPP